jgi:Rrf2 family protein
LQKLTRARILVSYKGKGGGFELKKNPARIRLVDIIKIFQGKIDLTQCMFRKKICPNLGECKLRKKIKKIEKYIVNEFSTVTLDFLISK